MDLIEEGEKIKTDLEKEDLSPEEALVQESLMTSITNSLIMITSILSEAKGIDPEKDFISTAEGTKTNIIVKYKDEDEDNWMSYGYGEDYSSNDGGTSQPADPTAALMSAIFSGADDSES